MVSFVPVLRQRGDSPLRQIHIQQFSSSNARKENASGLYSIVSSYISCTLSIHLPTTDIPLSIEPCMSSASHHTIGAATLTWNEMYARNHCSVKVHPHRCSTLLSAPRESFVLALLFHHITPDAKGWATAERVGFFSIRQASQH